MQPNDYIVPSIAAIDVLPPSKVLITAGINDKRKKEMATVSKEVYLRLIESFNRLEQVVDNELPELVDLKLALMELSEEIDNYEL